MNEREPLIRRPAGDKPTNTVKKNKLTDLHDGLFEQFERLGQLKGEALKEEIVRAQARNAVASLIISNGALMLNAAKTSDTVGGLKNLPMLE